MRSGSASTVHSHSSFARRIAARIDVSEVDMPPPQPATGLAPLRKAANSVARSDARSVESGRLGFFPPSPWGPMRRHCRFPASPDPETSGVCAPNVRRHRVGKSPNDLLAPAAPAVQIRARQGRPTDVRHVARVQSLAVLVLLSSCGGGGYGGGTNPQNASPGGIWNGMDSDSTLSVTGVIDESGHMRFMRADGIEYVGTVVTSGNSISANFDGYTPIGSSFSDGSTHETGMLSGMISARVSITASTQSTTDKGAVSKGTLALTFNPLYNQPSALAAIAGNYLEAGSSTAVSIDANGAIFSQDATTGCVVNG